MPEQDRIAPDCEAAHHVTYYRCTCGCDQFILRLHDEDGVIFATAVFSATEACSFGRKVGAMYPRDAIGEVAGHA